MLSLKENLKKKRFYEAYGKHILLIEIALILTITFTFVIQVFFPPPILPFTIVAWFVALFIIVLFHLRIFFRIANMELCPYEILRLQRLRFYFSVASILSYFLLFILSYLVSTSLIEIPSEISDVVLAILAIVAISLFPIVFIEVPLNLASIADHKKARLSFKTVLDAMELIRKENKANEKMKLIRKYVKWFRVGLQSYNSYLFESQPARLEIVDIDQYHRSVCSVALMGKQTEIENTIKQIRFALNCMERKREDDLRHFLIVLKNVKSGKRKKEYPLSELNEMIRILPFSERVKERLKSPYVALFFGVVAIVLQALRFVWK